MKRFLTIALVWLATLTTVVAQQGVPYFPQILPSGTVVGRLGTSAGPTEAIPFQALSSAVVGPSGIPLNVKTYGATGLGLVDDSGAVQAALNAAGALGGGFVYMPPGTYLCVTTLNVPSNVWIYGAGAASIISGPAGGRTRIQYGSNSVFAALATDGVNSHISDLKIDNQLNGTASNGVQLGTFPGFPATHAIVERVTVNAFASSSNYLIWNFSSNQSIIRDNVLVGNDTPGSGHDQNGIETAGGTDTLIYGNQISNISANGLNILELAGPLSSTLTRLVARDNNIFNVQTGISVSALVSVTNVRIINNKVRQSNNHAIVLSSLGTAVATDWIIAGNDIDGSAGNTSTPTGIVAALQSSVPASSIVMESNLITNFTAANGVGISLQGNGLIARGNTIRDLTPTGSIGIQTNGTTDAIIMNNRIVNVDTVGIYIQGGETRPQVFGNIIEGYATGSQNAGILVRNSTDAVIAYNSLKPSTNFTDTFAIDAQTTTRTQLYGNVTNYVPTPDAPFLGGQGFYYSRLGQQFAPSTDAASTLGDTVVRWGGLFLSAGTPVEWNNTILLAESSGTLQGTGASRYVFDAGLGYKAGAGVGGTVTQATNKTTAFTLSKITGQITFATGALGAGATAASTWTNTTVAAGDTVVFNHVSGGTIGAYHFNAVCAAGTIQLNITNISTGSLTEQPVVQYSVIKGSSN